MIDDSTRPLVRADLIRKNHNHVTSMVNRILDAPLPKPRNPRRMRVVWVLVGICLGVILALTFLVIPGAVR